ncbi:MAG: argininosuccinate lyase [Acetobacteraceae bacterium]|nr:argininosuccinate lyase [Acetobacteraceae bacterium]
MGERGGQAALGFTASLPFDRRLFRQDIAGSQAHVRALGRAGVLAEEEVEALCHGLEQVRAEMDAGRFEFGPEDPDIHLAVERALERRVGPLALKLRTGRSRNDQVCLDLRLFLMEAADQVVARIERLERELLSRAEEGREWLMPGHTHLQPAQPVLFPHHLLAYFWMLERDRERFVQARARTGACPAGAAALAGTAYPLDLEALAKDLGFPRVMENSLDATSDRDFALDFLAACAVLMVHLSRLATDVVLWCSDEFGFADLEEGWAGGSSIMPQKRNPEPAELVRGKAGRVFGHLLGLLSTLKGLPLGYASDLQEDKEAVFGAFDTVRGCLEAMAGVVRALRFRPEAMEAAAGRGFSTATEAADYLVRLGVPFVEAHRLVGEAVRRCREEGRRLEDLTLEEWRRLDPRVGPGILRALSPRAAVEARACTGGTAPARVAEALKRAAAVLGSSDLRTAPQQPPTGRRPAPGRG